MINQHEPIFGNKFVRKLIDSTPGFLKYLNENRSVLTQPIKKWLDQLEQGTIKDEESFQDPFTNAIFKEVLGYTRSGDCTPWTCTREYKILDGKSVDLALGFYVKGSKEDSTTFVVAEYKSPFYKDLNRKPSAQGMSPVDQAFNYAQRVGISHCHWIIVSNMDEIRLYHSSSMEKYESFRIAELASNASEFDRFYFLLSRQHLLPDNLSEKSFIDTLYDKNQADQAEINKKFYAVYSQARQNLFEDLIADNPETDKLHLLEKVQKILDRFLFMCFCEDKGYIGNVGETDPLTKRIFVNAMDSFTGSMWNEFLGIAKAIDRGAEKPIRIPPYDGGLFSPDSELEKLNVGNNAFAHLQPLAAYDFESELDVNILGHVFEQSVSDIEELKASINNEDFDKKKGKRKKQGIYYTPAYITGFIIEQTIGAWIEREKEKLGFASLPFISEDEDKLLSAAEIDKKTKLEKSLKEKAILHGSAWTKLQENLLNIRVLDPACGSGAFLNKAFWYLVKQHNQIYSQRQHYGAAENLKDFDISRVDYHIAKNNLFGVDLSKESVEITKLSLWLQLVYHKEKLPALESSIHFGDSIVSDPNYSKAAFDWQGNFPNILLNPSPSGRRCPEGTDEGVLSWPDYNKRQNLLSYASSMRKDSTDAEKVMWEMLRDRRFLDLKFRRQHVSGDFILDFYCKEKEFAIELDGGQHTNESNSEYDKRRTDILQKHSIKVVRFWNNDVLKNLESVMEALYNELVEKQPHPNPLLKGEGHSNKPSPSVGSHSLPSPSGRGEGEGVSGFDVVIGNPPYVRQEFLSPVKPALQAIYGNFYNGVADLYTYFYKRGFQLLKPDGYLGFITSSTFTKTGSGANLREFLKTETTVDRFVDFGDLQLFGDATNYPCILTARNTRPDENHKVAFSGIEVLSDLETSELLDNATQVENLQNQLGTDAWNFDRLEVEALRTKIFSKGKPLKEIVPAIYRGILTGLNEAFIIDKATRDRLIKEELEQRNKQPHPNPLLKGEGNVALPPPGEGGCKPDEGVSSFSSPSGRRCPEGTDEGVLSVPNDGLSFNSHPLIKPFLVGRDLKQWHYDFADRYLIAIQKGFTKQWAGKDIDEAEAWNVLKTNYPAIANQLKPFEEKAKKRQDQGDFWWELRACEYYKSFEEPKIVWPDMSRYPKFSLDNQKSFIANTAYMCKGSNYHVGLLTSRAIWFEIQSTAVAMRGGLWRYRLIYQTMEELLLVEPQGCEDDPSTDKGKLALLAKTAQEKAFKRLGLRKDFLEIIGDSIAQGKPKGSSDPDEVSEGSDINRWDILSWNDFVKKAQSPSAFGKEFINQFPVALQKTLQLKRTFEEMQAQCQQLTREIHECERQINEIVYRLYDLTPDEIKLLEELTGNIYED